MDSDCNYDALILMVLMSARRAVLSVCAGVLDGTGTARVLDPAPLEVRMQFCVANSSLKSQQQMLDLCHCPTLSFQHSKCVTGSWQ